VPQDTLRLWSVYEVQSGPFAGLGVGGGMRYVGSRTTNLVSQTTPNLVATLGAYATFDALAYYKYENAKLSVNVRNLFDAHYKEASPGYSWLFPSEPLNATLRLDVTF
jgi:iron complex outermembrane receptor protein